MAQSQTNKPILYSPESETALIRSVLLDGSHAQESPVVTRVTAASFGIPINGIIWAAIIKVAEHQVNPDPINVAEQLERDGQLEAVGGITYLIGLLQNANPLLADDYAKTVLDFELRRKVVARMEACAKKLHSGVPIADFLQEDASELAGLANEYSSDERTRLYSLADLLADTTPIPKDIVDGFIPGLSAILFSGPGGDGKSYALVDMAICIARGTPWLGLDVGKGPVLYIDLENRKVLQRERVRWILRGHNLLDDPPAVILTFGLNSKLDSDACVAEIVDLAKRCGARLVVLDSLSDFLGTLDENSNSDMAIFAARVRRISELISGSVIVIHHVPKNNADTPRGATALRDNTDVNIMVARDGLILSMKQNKNRAGPEMTVRARLNWQPRMFNLSPMGMSLGRPERKADVDEAELLSLTDDGDKHWSNVIKSKTMKKTGHSRRTVERKMGGLFEDLLLHRDPDRVRRKPYLVWQIKGEIEGPVTK